VERKTLTGEEAEEIFKGKNDARIAAPVESESTYLRGAKGPVWEPTRWCWAQTLVAFTEADVRREHPDAVKVEGSCVLVELPETEAEILAAQRPAHRGGIDRQN
jgi:hypothetical protein